MQLPALSIRQPNLARVLATASALKSAGLKNRLAGRKIDREDEINRLRGIATGSGEPSDTATTGPTAEAGAARPGMSEEAQAAFGQLVALDPKGTGQMIDVMDKMDARQLKQAREKSAMGASLAMQVLDAPPEQRPMAYAQALGKAQQMGLDVQSLPKTYQPRALHMIIARAMGVDKYGDYLEKQRNARADVVKIMTAKGIEYRRADQAAGQTPYEKPTALSGRIDTLIETGVPPNIAKGIAAGRYAKDRDPISGALQVVDMANGQIIYRSGEQADGQAAGEQPENTPKSALDPNVDYSQGTGASGAFGRIGNVVSDVLGAGLVAPGAEKAAQGLTNLQVRTQTMLQDTVPGRPSKYLLEQLGKLTVSPNSLFQGDSRSEIRLRQTRDMLQTEVTRMETEILGNPGAYRPEQIAKTRASVSQLRGILADYDVVLESFGDKSPLSKEDEDLVNKYLGGG